jgi:hypothetical protein
VTAKVDNGAWEGVELDGVLDRALSTGIRDGNVEFKWKEDAKEGLAGNGLNNVSEGK